MNAFRILVRVILLILFILWKDASASQLQDRPNVLIILTDDQGYHDVSYYGTGDLQTPNINQLAEEGMRFDNFYANSSVCAPTRAALLSGSTRILWEFRA